MISEVHRASPWIVLALVLSAAAPAIAEENKKGAPGDKSQAAPSAQEIYASAQKLFDQGNYAEALVAFPRAYNASGSPNARIMYCGVAGRSRRSLHNGFLGSRP